MAMNINDSFRYMQDYRVSEIPVKEIPKSPAPQELQEDKQQKPSVIIEPIEDKRPLKVDLNEVSMSFNRQEDYGYIGRTRIYHFLIWKKPSL